jgi:hypothetical protein
MTIVGAQRRITERTVTQNRKRASSRYFVWIIGATMVDDERRPISVLFVCLGNICRSPMAEAVFKSVLSFVNNSFRCANLDTLRHNVVKHGLEHRFKTIDS